MGELFDNVASMTATEFMGHFGYLLALTAYLLRDVLLLRMFIVLSCVVTGIYFVVISSWTPVFWQIVFLLVNAIWIMKLLYERRTFTLTEAERELHETLFREFTTYEFLKFLRVGEWRHLKTGDELIHKGRPVDRLYLISNGKVEVDTGSEGKNPRLRDGALIGEMSFMNREDATATVTAVEDTRVIAWEQEKLRSFLRRNPSMRAPIMSVIGADLTRKLAISPHDDTTIYSPI